MSLALTLKTVLRANSAPDAPPYKKSSLHQPEAALDNRETDAAKQYLQSSNFRETKERSNVWDPVRLASCNPTNEPAYAYTRVWANRPPIMLQSRRLLGLVKDQDAALRNVETAGHIQNYFNPYTAPHMPTLPPTPGYMRLPGLR